MENAQLPKEVDAVYESTDLQLGLACSQESIPPVAQEEINSEGAVWLLRGVLTPNECREYMKQAEALGLEEPVANARHRSSSRVVAMGKDVSNLIWSRISHFFPTMSVRSTDTSVEQSPLMNAAGEWKALGLNDCWRICRYMPGGHFGPHVDGYFQPSRTVRSLKTFMLYLNDVESSEDGKGATNFLHPQTLFKDEAGRYVAQPGTVASSVTPETGMAIVFNHRLLHEGGVLTAGTKWIMRSDVMYEQTSALSSPRQLSDADQEALDLVKQAGLLEADGRAGEAVELYRKASRISRMVRDMLATGAF